MKHFLHLLFAVVALTSIVSCENGNTDDNINDEQQEYDELPYFCDVSNTYGWSNIRFCKDGSTIFTKDNNASKSVQKTYMLIPTEEMGLVSIYGEYDDDGFPKYLAFNDAIIYIDNRTETTFDASIVIGDTPIWTAQGLKIDTKTTRAWGDNNWVRNTCAVGSVITNAISIGIGVSLMGTGVGTITGIVTIANASISLVNNFETLFGPPAEKNIAEELKQIMQDKSWDCACDHLKKSEEEYLNKWFKKHMGELLKLSWADFAFSAIDKIWGKTITESQKKLAILHAHRDYKIETGVAKDITKHTAELWGYVSPEALFPLGEFANAEYGIILYPTDDPHNRTSKYDIVGKGGTFSLLFRGLEYDTEYSYFVYYHDKQNQVSRFGETRKFKTRGEDDLRDMLIKFYHDTGGDNWYNNKNWCSNTPLEEWFGVSVTHDSNGKISGIDLFLSSNNLIGRGDLSGCTELESLTCEDNELTALDLSGCTELESLTCEDNELTALDLSGCTALKSLTITAPAALDVSGCTALKDLQCGALTSLNISGCSALEILKCSYCQFTTLNISGHPALWHLSCYDSHITSLNASGCTSLTYLDCYFCQLNSLNISGCTALEDLECIGNKLKSLDIYELNNIKCIDCTGNHLTSIHLVSNSLKTLLCTFNNLQSLDLSKCPNMKIVDCAHNPLEYINISGLNLSSFEYDNNSSLIIIK